MSHTPPLLAREAATLRPEQRRGVGALILGLHVAAAWGLLQSHVAPERVRDAVPVFFQMINLAPSTPHRPAPLPNNAASEPAPRSVAPALVVQAAVAPPPLRIPPSAVLFTQPPQVVYPRVSRRSRESGRVVVRAYIDTHGVPRQVQVEKSSGYARLDEAALAAVERARLKPHTENGQPVEGWARIPIDFDLES